MKTALVSMMFIFYSLGVLASGGDEVAETTKQTLAKEISRQLSYHHLASHISSGVAFVEVQMDEQGKFIVLQVNAATLEECNFIRKEMESLHLAVPVGAAGKTFAFRFEFVR